ncbi:DUF397 domain-containing protein [Streptomyces sp. TRM76130]|nr:DUF397 domain-containing protein [Streptomyces sp. TRM76130]
MSSRPLAGAVAPGPWIRSSYSNGAGGECVECARVGDHVLLRDTKVGEAFVAGVRAPAWSCFVDAVRRKWPEAR